MRARPRSTPDLNQWTQLEKAPLKKTLAVLGGAAVTGLALEAAMGSSSSGSGGGANIADQPSESGREAAREEKGWKTIKRFTGVEGTLANKNTCDAINFTVNKTIMLHGFGIYGGEEPGEITVQTMLYREEEDILMESYTVNGANEILSVEFNTPEKVRAGKTYSLIIYVRGKEGSGQPGPQTHSGTGGEAKVTEGGVTFTFSKTTRFDEEYIGQEEDVRSDIAKGQIPCLYFEP